MDEQGTAQHNERALQAQQEVLGGLPIWLFIIMGVVVLLAVAAILAFWYWASKRKEKERLKTQLELKMYRHEKKKAEKATHKMREARDHHESKYQQMQHPQPSQAMDPSYGHGQMNPSYVPQMAMSPPGQYITYTPVDEYGQMQQYGQMGMCEYGQVTPMYGGGPQPAAPMTFEYGAPALPVSLPMEQSGKTRKKKTRRVDYEYEESEAYSGDFSEHKIREATDMDDLPHGPAPIPPPGFVAVPMVMEPSSDVKRSKSRGRRGR